MQEESQVNYHSQGEQQHLYGHACPDEHNDSQHGEQAAVQVVLDSWKEMEVSAECHYKCNVALWQVMYNLC